MSKVGRVIRKGMASNSLPKGMIAFGGTAYVWTLTEILKVIS